VLEADEHGESFRPPELFDAAFDAGRVLRHGRRVEIPLVAESGRIGRKSRAVGGLEVLEKVDLI
jgi:hypothetical protein